MGSKRRQAPLRQEISLLEHFADLSDPRIDRTKLHALSDILVIAVSAVICGAEGWTDIEEFGKSKEGWLGKLLPLTNGIPSHDTFRRVFERLDPDQFEACFLSWIKSLAPMTGQVAIDGKTLRGSHDQTNGKKALHLVSAWASECRLVLGQVATAEKSNEITAIPELLKMLDLSGCLVTIDAMGCQTNIAAQIIAQEGDYLLAVKDNQKNLAHDVTELFDIEFAQTEPFEGFAHDYAKTIDKGHGRIEIRECWTITDPELLQYLRNFEVWSELKTIALVRGTRRVNGVESMQDRYYISSLTGDARTILQAVRHHWGIENSLHWVLDVVFREDQARMRQGDTAHNFAMLRHIALNLLRAQKSGPKSVRGKRLKAAWDNDFLLKVLLNSH
jgi:predicted transposase YbfD/YdcC